MNSYILFRKNLPQLVGFSPAVAKYVGMALPKIYYNSINSNFIKLNDYVDIRKKELKTFPKDKTTIPKDLPKEELQRLIELKQSENSRLRNEKLAEWRKTYSLSSKDQERAEKFLDGKVSSLYHYKVYELIHLLFHENNGHFSLSDSYANPIYVIATENLLNELILKIMQETLNPGEQGIHSFFDARSDLLMNSWKTLHEYNKCINNRERICPDRFCEMKDGTCVAKENCRDNDIAKKAFSNSLTRFKSLLQDCLKESLSKSTVPYYLFQMVLMIYRGIIGQLLRFNQEVGDSSLINEVMKFPESQMPIDDDIVLTEIEQYLNTNASLSAYPRIVQMKVIISLAVKYSNCVETTVNNICNMIVAGEDGKISPDSINAKVAYIHPDLASYYEKLMEVPTNDVSMNQDLINEFARILRGIPGVKLCNIYEVDSIKENYFTIIGYFFNVEIKTFDDFRNLSFGTQTVSFELKEETNLNYKVGVSILSDEGKNIQEVVRIGPDHSYIEDVKSGDDFSGDLHVENDFFINSICRVMLKRDFRVEIGSDLIENSLTVNGKLLEEENQNYIVLPKIYSPATKMLLTKKYIDFPYKNLITHLIFNNRYDREQFPYQTVDEFTSLKKIDFHLGESEFEFPPFQNVEDVLINIETGRISKSITKLESLKNLTIKGRDYSIPPELPSGIESLEINRAGKNLELPENLDKYPNLHTLNVKCHTLPKHSDFSKFTSLKSLETITDSDPVKLPDGLERLIIMHRHSEISKDRIFEGCSTLKRLDIMLFAAPLVNIDLSIFPMLEDVNLHNYSSKIVNVKGFGLSKLKIISLININEFSEDFGNLVEVLTILKNPQPPYKSLSIFTDAKQGSSTMVTRKTLELPLLRSLKLSGINTEDVYENSRITDLSLMNHKLPIPRSIDKMVFLKNFYFDLPNLKDERDFLKYIKEKIHNP